MDVLIITLFSSLLLVLGAVVFFAWTLAARSHEHVDRLALLPLQADQTPTCNTAPETL